VLSSFVALDVETTGLDPERDRITEVGLVRCDGDGRVVETFQSLVNPGREIPLFIEQLTGVTNDAVRDAPKLGEVASELLRFVGEGPVVGQNIGFDLAYLRREGLKLEAPAIDTASLSRILLPERENVRDKRGLMSLAAALGVEAGVHHRALPDAQTAAAIFVALLRMAGDIPAVTRLQLARLVSLSEPLLAGLIAGEEWEDLPPGERELPTIRPAPSFPALTKREHPIPIAREELDRVFGAAHGVIERFEERQEQREMAEAVREAMLAGHWLIEAGTGVGKSLAYLIPAALHALKNGERVVISTNTINLQEQLLKKDIPALKRILKAAGVIEDESELRASLLKGRANYLCVRRWTASYGQYMADPDFASLASSMLLWLPKTETGDRSELSLDHQDYLTWQRFSAADTDCLQRPNRYVRGGQCFLARARRAAETAHIVIVNHALLLADIAAGGSALPPFDHLIVDEAHNLEDTATRQFGGSASRRSVSEALEGIHRPRGRDHREGGVATLLKAFPEGGALQMAGAGLEAAVERAQAVNLPLFEALALETPRTGEDDRLLVDRSTRARPSWTNVENACAELDVALKDVCARAETAIAAVKGDAPVEEPDALAGEIETAARKVEDLRLLLSQLVNTQDDLRIVWIARERDRTASINAAPLNVGPTLWEELFSKKRSVVATSATLSAAGDMNFAARSLGIERPRTLQLGSPYDYKRSTLLAAFTDIPEPSAPEWAAAVAAAVTKLVTASDGRALVLFTSHASLQAVDRLAREDIENAGISVLAQGTDGTPRQLIDQLIANPKTVILGTSSFWEGVDVRGKALSMLVICRLPFAVPTDPVQRARAEQHESPFAQYSLPSAILRFRQGFGRLIRDREDHGVVAVLDRRIYEKRYGQDFVDALPRCTAIKADTDTVAARAREWLDG
jgi:DNA polymerase-3 subunit epsilon/ATP-dependent DNA helicase DinG